MLDTFFIFILTILCLQTSVKTETFIRKCNAKDSQCIKESAQAALPIVATGIPKYGVSSLDPFFLKRVDASVSDLKHIISNTTITGLKNCNVKEIKRNQGKKKIQIQLVCSCQLDGQYEMSGKLSILPIEGKGAMHITLRKIEITLKGDLVEEPGKDNKKFWQIKNWTHTFKLNDKSDVKYENLFRGNKALSGAAQGVLSTSGNDLIYEVGPKLIQLIVKEIVDTVNKLFSMIPAEELSID